MELSRSEPLVSCTAEENGEHVIAACCEPHVEICHVIVAGASGRGAVSVGCFNLAVVRGRVDVCIHLDLSYCLGCRLGRSYFFAVGRPDGRNQGEQVRPRHMLGDGPRHCRRISRYWFRVKWILQPCGCQKPGGRLHPRRPWLLPRRQVEVQFFVVGRQVEVQFFVVGRHEGRDQAEQELPLRRLCDGPRHCRRSSRRGCRVTLMQASAHAVGMH